MMFSSGYWALTVAAVSAGEGPTSVIGTDPPAEIPMIRTILLTGVSAGGDAHDGAYGARKRKPNRRRFPVRYAFPFSA
jgi:hypothetical protein